MAAVGNIIRGFFRASEAVQNEPRPDSSRRDPISLSHLIEYFVKKLGGETFNRLIEAGKVEESQARKPRNRRVREARDEVGEANGERVVSGQFKNLAPREPISPSFPHV